MTTFSFTNTSTFTVTNARYLAAKVATDLKRIQRFYNVPSDKQIENYENELIEILKEGYLDYVTYGFLKNGIWIKPTLKYTAIELTNGSTDDDPGKIQPNADVSNSIFSSFMSYNAKWIVLSQQEKLDFEKKLPIQRTSGNMPQSDGYFSSDLVYESGGKSMNRSTLR